MREAAEICSRISQSDIERMAQKLAALQGKLYIIGLGGSLANAIHMASDLRKLCDIDAEAFDNISEFTARANDEGMETIFVDWLKRSTAKDALFVLSVGGGTHHTSNAIIKAINAVSCPILGIVGPDGGYTSAHGDVVIRVPVENRQRVTPHTEAFQAVIWHCLVSHPMLQKRATKW